MEFIKKNLVGLIAIVIALGAIFGIGHSGKLGAVSPNDSTASNFTELTASDGLAVGSTQQFQVSSAGAVLVGASGTAVTRLNTGTCYLRPRATTIAATTTATVECQATAATKTPWGTATGAASALTGVASGDFVHVQLATTTAMGGTAPTFGGLVVTGATASSTQGYIQLLIANLTGDTFTWPITGNATGTATYIVFK